MAPDNSKRMSRKEFPMTIRVNLKVYLNSGAVIEFNDIGDFHTDESGKLTIDYGDGSEPWCAGYIVSSKIAAMILERVT